MKHFFSFFAALLLFGAIAGAKVQMPSVFSDNMVLQQQTEVALWGSATGKSVTVSASWAPGKEIVATVKRGKWAARLATPAAGGPFELKVSDGEELVFKNVLIGEVWFCSGQSNMSMPLRGFVSQPVEGAAEVIVSAKPSVPIRMCMVKRRPSIVAEEDCECTWKENTPEVVALTSATAYFFAKRIQESLDVPVGIINADWGGTPIESWMSREAMEKEFENEFDLAFLDEDKVPEFKPHRKPCTLYNGMVAPLIPFTFRGMIWYQGEANRSKPELYTRMQTAYVKMMREVFQNPDAPFYFVQIAPYAYNGDTEKFASGYFYEAQQKTLEHIPHSGMAPTIDLGEEGTIHPCRKKEVGDRLAFLALVDTYGVPGINPHAPTYKSVSFNGSEAVVTFNVSKLGLAPMGRNISGFEVAGEDKAFHPATAKVQKNTVIVSSEEVSNPVAVRYCFRNWGVGTLYNAYGIPALPFRTDDWDDLEK